MENRDSSNTYLLVSGSLFAFFVSLIVLLYNLAPSLTVGDSGEFIASAKVLGVAHSPGYPLYLLLGKIALSIFPGSLAFRMNIMSAMCGAAALTGLWLLWFQFGSRFAVCGIVLLILLFNPLIGEISMSTEVFSMLALSIVAALAAFLARKPVLGAFLCGLSLGNHHTILFLAPVFLYLWIREIYDPASLFVFTSPAAKQSRDSGAKGEPSLKFSSPLRGEDEGGGDKVKSFRINFILISFLFFFIGFSIHAYLPIAAKRNPVMNWGNPQTVESLTRLVLRKDYGTFSLTTEGQDTSTIMNYANQVKRLVKKIVSHPTGLFLLVFAVLAWIFSLIHVFRPLIFDSSFIIHHSSLLSFLGFFLSGPLFLWIGNPPFDSQTEGALSRFYAIPLIFAAMSTPAGIRSVFSMISSRIAPTLSALVALVIGAFLFIAPGKNLSQRHNFLSYDFGRNIIKSLPYGARLFIEGGDDTMYSMAYFLFAEGRRKDLQKGDIKSRVHDRAGLVLPNPYPFEFRKTPKETREANKRKFEDHLAKKESLYYHTLRLDLIEPGVLLPTGLIQFRKDSLGKIPFHMWDKYSLRGLRGSMSEAYRERALIPYYFFARAQTYLSIGDAEKALNNLRIAHIKGKDVRWANMNIPLEVGEIASDHFNKGEWVESGRIFKLAGGMRPEIPSFRANLCVIKEKISGPESAIACYENIAEEFPGYAPNFKNWGASLWHLRRMDEARTVFKRALSLGPDPQLEHWIRRIGGEKH
ncbi:protein O-mannosyl-transferase family [Elusimicrobiota bacterium]